MTEKQAKLRIIELHITVQNQEHLIERLTNALALLTHEVDKLPGGSDLLNKLATSPDDFIDDKDE